MRSSTVHVPEPLLPELTCHCSPTIWLAVGVADADGLSNAVNRVVKVVAVAVAAARVAAGYRSHAAVVALHVPPVGFVRVVGRSFCVCNCTCQTQPVRLPAVTDPVNWMELKPV